MTDCMPKVQCPKCRHWQTDWDGFGVIACENCDYCTHPAEDFIGGFWVCGICERKRSTTGEGNESE